MPSISNIAPEITLLGYIDSPIPHATSECHNIDPNTPGLIDHLIQSHDTEPGAEAYERLHIIPAGFGLL